MKPSHAGPRLPSREELVAYISGASGKVGKREIARAFNIDGGDRIWLKQTLRELEDEGVVDRRGKRVRPAGHLPPLVLADIRSRDRDGELVAEPIEWDATAHGPTPKIIVSTGRRPHPGSPVPGVGDRALLRVERLNDGEGRGYLGRVVKLVAKEKASVLGVFRAASGGGGRLVPVDKKARGGEIQIAAEHQGEAQDGDLVTASIAKQGRYGLPHATILERLGSLTSEKAISLVAVHAHAIPHVFSREALAEAESAAPLGMTGREDWTALPLVTIDPSDAKDHDDAVHAASDDDPANPHGFVITVAIADVAAYVRPGSALDREALERGNSVYFPDRVVPMLPERISNDLCSLRPREPRRALAVRMIVAADGRIRRHSFHRVMMRSAAKLSYQEAQAAIDGRPNEEMGPLLEPVLQPLWRAYEALRTAREAREPLDLDLPERKILLKEDGTVDRVLVPERLEAHRLIEEFMIQANVAAAEALEKARSVLIYRVHNEPSLEKMRVLGEVLASIGIKLPKQGALNPALFNRVLGGVNGTEHQIFINEVVLRSQAQAEYAAENYGHFGLNLRRYAHFTSPIRRYADLVVHRALIGALRLGPDGLPDGTRLDEVAEVAGRISIAERRAMAAERETIDRLIAHHLADRVGAIFVGKISGVTRSGLFVKLAETGADGFIPAGTIGADYYRYEEDRHSMVGERTGETFRLGDAVEVKLIEAAPVAGALRFELVSQGRFGARPRKGERPGSRQTSIPRVKANRPTRERAKENAWTPLDD